MCGDAETVSFTGGAFSPSGFFRRHFDHAAQSSGIERVPFCLVCVLRAVVEIHNAPRSNQFQQVLNGIFLCVIGKLIGERAYRKRVVDVGYAAEPSDTDVCVGGPILGAMVRDIERKIVPSQAPFAIRVLGALGECGRQQTAAADSSTESARPNFRVTSHLADSRPLEQCWDRREKVSISECFRDSTPWSGPTRGEFCNDRCANRP